MTSLYGAVADRIERRADPYATDPVGWARDKRQAFLWSKQRAVAESVRDHRYTAVHSAHEMGKSFDAGGIIVPWWMDTHPPGEAFVVSTAPTFSQVRAILWKEIGRAHRDAKLRGKVNQTEWWMDDEIVGFGRKPADYDPAAFQGIHARYLLVVIDEACGVPKAIFDAVDSLVTNDDCRVLAIGNPDDPASHFRDICKPSSGWNVIHIDGLQSPNFTDEQVPDDVARRLLSQTWVEERRQRWGEGSPLWTAKVRGLFPDDSADGVVRLSSLVKCQQPRDTPPRPTQLLPVELGLDVGAGGDFTAIRERRGRIIGRTWHDHSNDARDVFKLALHAIRETGATSIKVDVGGIGWGVVGYLNLARDEGKHHAAVHAVNFGSAALDPERFPLLRDQLWWDIGRELSDDRAIDLSDAEDADDLVAQLIAPHYALDAHGRIKVEKKDETRKRIGRSPDDADAYLLALYQPLPDVDEVVEFDDGGARISAY